MPVAIHASINRFAVHAGGDVRQGSALAIPEVDR
jgi:hypothetical protein